MMGRLSPWTQPILRHHWRLAVHHGDLFSSQRRLQRVGRPRCRPSSWDVDEIGFSLAAEARIKSSSRPPALQGNQGF